RPPSPGPPGAFHSGRAKAPAPGAPGTGRGSPPTGAPETAPATAESAARRPGRTAVGESTWPSSVLDDAAGQPHLAAQQRDQSQQQPPPQLLPVALAHPLDGQLLAVVLVLQAGQEVPHLLPFVVAGRRQVGLLRSARLHGVIDRAAV